MIFSDEVLLKISIFLLGLCGFLVARHIYKHKKAEHKPLVCPMHFDCNAVVHSDYSKFLGIPVEIFGMAHYALTGIFYFTFIFFQNSLPIPLVAFFIGLSIVAFLFSIYLILVQLLILKKGCFWCFISAIISFLIFILTILAYDLGHILQILIK